MACSPLEVGRVDVAVGSELEGVFAQAGHGDVASDPAGVVQQEGVGDGPRLLGHVGGCQFLQQLQGSGAGDLKALERSHVVHGHSRSGLPRLSGGDGGAEHPRPGVTCRRLPFIRHLLEQFGIGLEPVRALPPSGFQEEATQLLVAGVERANAQVPRRELWLQWVQDVVDFHEVLLGRFADVFGGQLDLFESVDVAVPKVDLRLAGGQEFGDGTGDAGGVGDPDGFGDEEAIEFLGLTHQGRRPE